MSVTKIDKNKYRIFISDGTNLDGSRRRFSKTITTDLKGRDLEKFLTLAEYDFEDEVKKKDPKFNELSKGTLKNYYNWWIGYKVEHEKLEATTKDLYDRLMRNRITPFAGNNKLETLTNGDMLELMSKIRNSPAKTKSGRLSDKYIKHHHTLLKVLFNDAMKLNILTDNPMQNITVKTPKTKVKDNYYDVEDIQKLVKSLSKENSKYRLAILLTMSTGMRVGELTALKWNDIDLQSMRIDINKANAYSSEGSYIKDTKTEGSQRVLAFPPVLVNLFMEHKENEILKKEYNEDRWQGSENIEDNFVFTQDDGKVIFVDSIPHWFRKFLRKNNLKYITFHGLRHTNSTVLISKGINIVSVSHNLGHDKVSTTTDLYSHHLESVEESMANIFNEIIVESEKNTSTGTTSGTNDNKLRLIK